MVVGTKLDWKLGLLCGTKNELTCPGRVLDCQILQSESCKPIFGWLQVIIQTCLIMDAPSKQQVLEHRQRLKLEAQKLFSDFKPGKFLPQGTLFACDYSPPQVSLGNRSAKTTEQKKRKVSEDISVFQNSHKTRQVCLSSNFCKLFEILAKIGQGAQSTVRLCKEKSTGTVYAVKCFSSDTELIANLKLQYKILKTISHPNVIQAHYLFVNPKENSSHMILDYCEFPSLRDHLRETPLMPEEEALGLVCTLAQTVDYLHSKGICHRDIKPENILYQPKTGELRLIDFEIAKSFKGKFQRVQMWTRTGTLQYCAPQMFQGSYTEMVDIWAIGILTFEILCGRHPFQFEYVGDLPAALQMKIQYPPTMSQFARDFVQRCLAYSPLKRFTSKQTLSSPFLLTATLSHSTIRSQKFNRSFEQGSSTERSYDESLRSSVCYLEDCEAEQLFAQDIGIRCFTYQQL